MNQISVITIYRSTHGIWTFTDATRELQDEPFVGTTNHILDRVTGGRSPCAVMFSTTRFPGAEECLTVVDEDAGGAWYRDTHGVKGWLCAAMYRYFDHTPDTIWVCAKNEDKETLNER